MSKLILIVVFTIICNLYNCGISFSYDRSNILLHRYKDAFDRRIDRGKRFFSDGKYSLSIKEFNRAIDINPESDIVYRLRGAAFEKNKQIDKAENDFISAIEINPNKENYFVAVTFYSFNHKLNNAIKLLEKYISMYPNEKFGYELRSGIYYDLNNYDEAINDLKRAMDFDSVGNANEYVRLARLYEKQGDLDNALKSYDSAINISMGSSYSYRCRAEYFLKNNMLNKALTDLRKCLIVEPNYANFSKFIRVLSDSNGSNDVVGDFRAAYNYKPIDFSLNQVLEVYKKNRKLDSVLEEFEKTLNDNSDIWDYLITAFILNYKKFDDKAISVLSNLIYLHPGSALGYEFRMKIFIREGEYSKALSDAEKLIKLLPTSNNYIELANLCFLLHKNDDALLGYNKSVSIDNKNIKAYSSRGNFYKQIHENKKAIKDFKKIISLKKSASNYLNLALLYFDMGRYSDSISTLDNGIALYPTNTPILKYRGRLKIYNGDKMGAVDDLRKVASLKKTPSAYIELGNLYKMLDMEDEALNAYNKSIEMSPGESNGYIARGGFYLDLNITSEAIADFKKAIIVEPTVKNYLKLGSCFMGLNRYEEAYSAYSDAIKINTDDPAGYYARKECLLKIRRTDEAVNDWRKYLRIKKSINEYEEFVKFCNNNDRYEDAKMAIDEAIINHPHEEQLYKTRSEIFRKLGNRAAEISDLQNAIIINSSVENYLNLSSVYIETGAYSDALALLSKALEKYSNDVSLIHKRGDLYVEMDNKFGSIDDFKKLVELSPSAISYVGLADTYAKFSMSGEVLDTYNRAINKFPENSYLYERRSQYFLEIGNKEQSLKDYLKVVELSPSSLNYMSLAQLYIKLGDNGRALLSFSESISIDPSSWAPYISRGELFYKMGIYENAISDYKKAFEVDPSVYRYASLADLYYRIGDVQNAKAAYDNLIKKFPDETYSYLTRGKFYMNVKDFAAAFRDFLEMVSIVPSSENYRFLGQQYFKIKEYEKSIHAFNECIHESPGNWKYYHYRALSWVALGQSDKAELDFRKALLRGGIDEDLYLDYINFLRDNYDYKNVINVADLAIKNGVKTSSIFREKGCALFLCGDILNAKIDLKKSINLNRSDDYSYNLLGEVYRRLGDYETAIEYYKKSIKINNKQPYAYYNLGYTYFRLGRPYLSVANYTDGLINGSDLFKALSSLTLKDVLRGNF